ncbi:hypothetical protein Tco_0317072 [Tanacetum coccineum]
MRIRKSSYVQFGQEKDQLTEAQKVSLAEAVSAKEAEEKENVERVEKGIISEEVDKMVEGDEEVDERFADSLILSQEDPDTRIDLGSHKKSPEKEKEDDDDYVDISLVRRKQTCSLEFREEQKQTPLTTPLDPPRLTYLWTRHILLN